MSKSFSRQLTNPRWPLLAIALIAIAYLTWKATPYERGRLAGGVMNAWPGNPLGLRHISQYDVHPDEVNYTNGYNSVVRNISRSRYGVDIFAEREAAEIRDLHRRREERNRHWVDR